MAQQRPRITEDGHVVYEWVPDEDTGPTTAEGHTVETSTDQPAEAHDEADQADGHGEGTGSDRPPRIRGRWRWVVAAVVIIALLLGGYALWNRLTMDDEGTAPVGQTDTGSGDAAQTRKAEQVALDHTAAGIAAEAKKMCSYETDPDDCMEVAKLDDPLTATDPPHVIQSAAVSRPSGVTGGSVNATAVLVEYTIKDQANAQREVVFVRDSDDKVLGTERTGGDDAGKSLQMIFREEGEA